jgi:hypothetical protein
MVWFSSLVSVRQAKAQPSQILSTFVLYIFLGEKQVIPHQPSFILSSLLAESLEGLDLESR